MTTRSHGTWMAALWSAAAALDPALAHAADDAAATAPEDRFGYRAHDYDEAAFTGPAISARDRYHVHTQQFELVTTRDSGFVVSVDGLIETMSGSSPWYAIPDRNGAPIQVLSGATIAERRRELGVAVTTPARDGRRHTGHLQVSREDDYRAIAAGYEWSAALSHQLTLALGANASEDRLEPTDSELHDRIDHASKHSRGAFASLTAVLDRDTQLQAGLTLTHADGYLSDPYKRVFVVDDVLRDARPGERLQTAAIVRWRRAYADIDAALHVDYRGSRDDWGLTAHALELRWLQSFGDYEFAPGLRWYSQDGADFYATLHTALRDDGHYSSDYRLSRYGAVSGSLELRRAWKQLAVTVSAERYRSDEDYALGGGDETVPGLVTFTRWSAGFDWSW